MSFSSTWSSDDSVFYDDDDDTSDYGLDATETFHIDGTHVYCNLSVLWLSFDIEGECRKLHNRDAFTVQAAAIVSHPGDRRRSFQDAMAHRTPFHPRPTASICRRKSVPYQAVGDLPQRRQQLRERFLVSRTRPGEDLVRAVHSTAHLT